MRRMYSKEQINKLIEEKLSDVVVEEDLSNVVITKGAPTNEVYINMVRVGHCTTITGSVRVVNLNPDPTEVIAFTCKNLFSDNIDGDDIMLMQEDSGGYYSLATGYINFARHAHAFIIRAVPTGVTTYYIDVNIIDDTPLPVEA